MISVSQWAVYLGYGGSRQLPSCMGKVARLLYNNFPLDSLYRDNDCTLNLNSLLIGGGHSEVGNVEVIWERYHVSRPPCFGWYLPAEALVMSRLHLVASLSNTSPRHPLLLSRPLFASCQNKDYKFPNNGGPALGCCPNHRRCS